jgi:threonine dehydratase
VEPQFKDILLAQEKAKGIIHPSPLVRSSYFSRIFGAEILLKLENLQETGSFKVRGAYNRLRELTSEERQRGVITASAGNHAQGVAWASTRLGIKASIVMPEDVSIRKLLAVKDYGAEIILHGARFDQAYARGLELSRDTGQVFIPAFADPLVVAGQGTIGLELSEFVDRETAIVVPVGGGGLISGVAIAAKALSPSVRVVGVQTRSCPSAILSLKKGKPVAVEVSHTIADGIAVNRPGDLNFSLIQRLVDEMVDVDEEAIAGAILSLLDKASIVAEGAGAVPLAALMERRVSTKANRYILVVSGGNLEINTMDRILHRGSIQMGRLLGIEVDLPDVPGSLWHLMGIIAEQKANVLHIFHDRFNLENPIQVTRVKLSLETRGHDHAMELLRKLRESGYDVKQTL